MSFGVSTAENPVRKASYLHWLETIQIDEEILVTCRMMIGDAQKRRIRFPVPDSLIAAAAFARGLTVVTRNVRDFVPLGMPVFNPWTGQSFNTPA
jgi:predicted nucleic acid-binding protein